MWESYGEGVADIDAKHWHGRFRFVLSKTKLAGEFVLPVRRQGGYARLSGSCLRVSVSSSEAGGYGPGIPFRFPEQKPDDHMP